MNLTLAAAASTDDRTIDLPAARRAAADLLRALGAILDCAPGLMDTPRRMAEAYG